MSPIHPAELSERGRPTLEKQGHILAPVFPCTGKSSVRVPLLKALTLLPCQPYATAHGTSGDRCLLQQGWGSSVCPLPSFVLGSRLLWDAPPHPRWHAAESWDSSASSTGQGGGHLSSSHVMALLVLDSSVF